MNMAAMSDATHDIKLLGCGILRKEIALLIEKNHWPIVTLLMSSGLHNDYQKLEKGLNGLLRKHLNDKTIVFYGCCHPLMNKFVAQGHSVRVNGQNCIEMLLGPEMFAEELQAGAYFLLEEWALNWQQRTSAVFGTNPAIIREIFQEDRKYFLGINTPTSGDFSVQAQDISRQVGLPLRWMNCNLDRLEMALANAIAHYR